MSILHQTGYQWMSNNHLVDAPSSGGTFQQNGLAFGLSTVGAGTYRLPDNGLPMFVRATGAVYILNGVDTDVVAILASGQVALFIPTSSTTWSGTLLTAAPAVTLPATKVTTSSTASTVTPGAGALTGADHVYWVNTADGALALTTRTAVQMISDIFGVSPVDATLPSISYKLTIVNRGNNTITITGDTGVTLPAENTVATLVTRTYVVSTTGEDIQWTLVDKGTVET